MKIRMNRNSILLYLILIPFLHPRGFDEYFVWYKSFFTSWLYISIFLIGAFFVYTIIKKKEQYDINVYIMLVYFSSLIFITALLQSGFNVGLQKMFATPALCIACAMLLKENAKLCVDILGNILLLVLALNVFVFNYIFFGDFFSAEEGVHLLFIGHVQIAAPLGVLGIYVGYILHLYYGKWNMKCKLLILCSVLTMVLSSSVASIISLVILALGLIYIYCSKNGMLLKFGSKLYIGLYAMINVILILYLSKNNWSFSIGEVNLNGRGFIWQKVFEKIVENPLLGYGVHGVRVKVFWSQWIGDGEGMNYAHNQILQQMLDGGIVLLILFFCLLLSYTGSIRKINHKGLMMFSNLLLVISLFVMIFESSFEYYYIFILFSIFASLPYVEKNLYKGGI